MIATELDINNLIRKYHAEWQSRGKWQRPSLADAVAFVGEEVDELVEAADGPSVKVGKMLFEAFDIYMMCLVSADLSGCQLFIHEIVANPDVIIRKMIKAFFKINRARLQCTQGYCRNNPQGEAWDELAAHLSEMASLAVSFVRCYGQGIDEIGKAKLAEMEAKRK